MSSSRTSDLLTADTLIATGRNFVNAVTLIGGSTASSVILYDGLTATGKVLAKATQVTQNATTHLFFECPVICETGIYADVSGTSAEFIVYYGGC